MITGNETVINIGANDLAWAGYTRVGAISQAILTRPRRLLAGDEWRPMMGGDDMNPGVVMMDILFDPREELPEPTAPARWQNTYQLVLTFQAIGETPASITGSGFVASRTYPLLMNDKLAIARLSFQFDGYVPPVFSKET